MEKKEKHIPYVRFRPVSFSTPTFAYVTVPYGVNKSASFLSPKSSGIANTKSFASPAMYNHSTHIKEITIQLFTQTYTHRIRSTYNKISAIHLKLYKYRLPELYNLLRPKSQHMIKKEHHKDAL